jgi:hypothetical protein
MAWKVGSEPHVWIEDGDLLGGVSEITHIHTRMFMKHGHCPAFTCFSPMVPNQNLQATMPSYP